MKALRPYIGITGFKTSEQVSRLAEVFAHNRKPGSDRLLHVGVMMSYRTLNKLTSRFTNVFPASDTVRDIFAVRHEGTYNCLHWADYVDDTEWTDLERAIDLCGPNLDAVQLDMTWPLPTMINRVKDMFRGRSIEFILQIGKKAIEIHHGDSGAIARVISLYGDSIDRVLLDTSMGNGIGINHTVLADMAEAIESEAPYLGIVVAGGLGPGKTYLLGDFAQRPGISIDAQAGLTVGRTIMDSLDLDLATQYLQEFLPILD